MHTQTHGPDRAQKSPPESDFVNQRLLERRRAFLAYFRYRLGNAQDAFQDYYLKVIRSARPLQNAKKTDVWLGCTMRNTLIDYHRRPATRKHTEITYAQEVKITANAVKDTQVETSCKCLGAALLDLKPEYSSLLRRAYLDEEPRSRIAVDLGITANSLNVRLHRARRALKSTLESSCPACLAGSFMDCDCE
ncbi:MAG: sigma-70 family RNA polymerase sigma factor [Roseovarius sp.]|nr:sigma-70 family RNA polymerase sigma factor [Roseovarius sp.]